MSTSPLQEQVHSRLDRLSDRADAITRYTKRCHELVKAGLARDVAGMGASGVVAQYVELTAMTASLLKADADSLAKWLRSMEGEP